MDRDPYLHTSLSMLTCPFGIFLILREHAWNRAYKQFHYQKHFGARSPAYLWSKVPARSLGSTG
jgi:hypothetical protein